MIPAPSTRRTMCSQGSLSIRVLSVAVVSGLYFRDLLQTYPLSLILALASAERQATTRVLQVARLAVEGSTTHGTGEVHPNLSPLLGSALAGASVPVSETILGEEEASPAYRTHNRPQPAHLPVVGVRPDGFHRWTIPRLRKRSRRSWTNSPVSHTTRR